MPANRPTSGAVAPSECVPFDFGEARAAAYAFRMGAPAIVRTREGELRDEIDRQTSYQRERRRGRGAPRRSRSTSRTT